MNDTDTTRPNSSNDLVKPDDPVAVLYVPTAHDADRLHSALSDLHNVDEGVEKNDETLWAEMMAQLNKQK